MKKFILLFGFLAFTVCMMNSNIVYAQKEHVVDLGGFDDEEVEVDKEVNEEWFNDDQLDDDQLDEDDEFELDEDQLDEDYEVFESSQELPKTENSGENPPPIESPFPEEEAATGADTLAESNNGLAEHNSSQNQTSENEADSNGLNHDAKLPTHWVTTLENQRVVIVNLHVNPNYNSSQSVSVTDNPKYGQVKINHDATLYYLPNDLEGGQNDSFTYTLTDKQGYQFKSTVKIVIKNGVANGNVSSRNPTVKIVIKKRTQNENTSSATQSQKLVQVEVGMEEQRESRVTPTENEPIILNIGDYTPSSQSLTLDTSKNSQVFDNLDGTLTYLPNPGFDNAKDTFSYRITDAEGYSNFFSIQFEIGEVGLAIDESHYGHDNNDGRGNNDYNAQFAMTYAGMIVTLEVSAEYNPKKHKLILYSSENSRITFNRDATITYIANQGFEGVDIFYYELLHKKTKTSKTFQVKVQVKGELEIPPVDCNTVYLVHDESAKDSQLLTIPDPLGVNNVAETLGPIYKGLDIEGLAIHPQTKKLYAVSGSGPSNSLDGYLYLAHPQSGLLKEVGDTGYSELASLAFHPTKNTLWAWSAGGSKINPEGPGLLHLDPDTAEVLHFHPSPWTNPKMKIEGLTWMLNDLVWGTGDHVLYATQQNNLWAFKGLNFQHRKVCDNLPGEVEALETLAGGWLLFALHNYKGNTIHLYDPVRCEEPDLQHPLLDKGHRLFETALQYQDVESIAWTLECQPEPTVQNVKRHKITSNKSKTNDNGNKPSKAGTSKKKKDGNDNKPSKAGTSKKKKDGNDNKPSKVGTSKKKKDGNDNKPSKAGTSKKEGNNLSQKDKPKGKNASQKDKSKKDNKD
jgi:hypothetical protein